MEALHDVVKAGKARYIGASSMFAWQFAQALYVADCNGWTRFVSMQNHYNLIYREEEREMIPLCQDQGIGMIPWSPLARGFLAGNRNKQGGETTRAKTDEYAKQMYYQDDDFAIADRLAEVAKAKRASQYAGGARLDSFKARPSLRRSSARASRIISTKPWRARCQANRGGNQAAGRALQAASRFWATPSLRPLLRLFPGIKRKSARSAHDTLAALPASCPVRLHVVNHMCDQAAHFAHFSFAETARGDGRTAKRMPLGFSGGLVSNGMAFLFAVM